MSKLLIESMPVQMQIVESKGDKLIARGEFGRVGVPTQNGRIYPESIMLGQIDRLDEDITNRRVLGELDHPTDGKTSLKRVSHVITGLKIKDGIIIGEAEILNTPEGKTLQALIEAKVQLGVSSRGFGSTKPSTDPKMEGDIVQEDFILKTWDFVADPAVKTALPGIYNEDVDDQSVSQADMFLAEFPEIAKQIQEEAIASVSGDNDSIDLDALSEQYEKRFAEALIEARDEISNDLREEFESDPEMGGAKATLEAILDMASQFRATPDEKAAADALEAKDKEVAEAAEMAAELARRAIQAEALLAAELRIGSHPMAESVRSLISKRSFDNSEDAVSEVESILGDFPDSEDIITRGEVELREENARLEGKVSLLEEKAGALSVKLKKAVDVGLKADSQLEDVESQVLEAVDASETAEANVLRLEEKLELVKYKYEKIVGLPNGRKMLSLLEDVDSKKQVDVMVSGRGVSGASAAELAEMKHKLIRGKGKRSGQEKLHEDDKSHSDTGVDELGNDMGNMLRLAGIGPEMD